jgi:hypothetical protein
MGTYGLLQPVTLAELLLKRWGVSAFLVPRFWRGRTFGNIVGFVYLALIKTH